jgi:acyl dehydratase
MLSARQLYFEAVKVGDELPPLVKPPIDRLQIARYAGAAQDWNPLYLDEPFARNSGFPSAFAPGTLAMASLGELVVDWVRGARLRRFSARFVKIVWPGDVLTARGRVTDRRFEENGRYAIDIEVWAENQRGELVVRGSVGFQLYYSAEDEARQRAGQGPLVVTPQEEEARLAKLSRAQPPKAPASRPLAPARPAAAVAARPQPGQPKPSAAALGSKGAPATKLPAGAPPPRPVAPLPRPAVVPPQTARPAAAAPSTPAAPPARPAAKPAAKRPAVKPSRKAPPRAAPAKAARARPASKAKPGKAKAARPHPAKRPGVKEKAASARARARGPAKKPSAKKRR